MSTTSTPTPARRDGRHGHHGVGAALVGLALLLAPAALTACGKDAAGGPEVASLQTDDTTGDGGASEGEQAAAPLTEEERTQAVRDFAACMREHGVDMPDPDMSGGSSGKGGMVFSAPAVAVGEVGPDGSMPPGPDLSTMNEAQEACQEFMDKLGPNGPMGEIDPEEEAKMREQALAFAACMREHGIDMPDPQFEGEGRMTQQGPAGGIEFDEEAMKAATDACATEGGPGSAIMIAPGGADGPTAGFSVSGGGAK